MIMRSRRITVLFLIMFLLLTGFAASAGAVVGGGARGYVSADADYPPAVPEQSEIPLDTPVEVGKPVTPVVPREELADTGSSSVSLLVIGGLVLVGVGALLLSPPRPRREE